MFNLWYYRSSRSWKIHQTTVSGYYGREKNAGYYCAFWINHLDLYKDDPKWLVIDGASWIVCPYVPASERGRSFMGCGGREMKAITEDGREFFLQ